MCEDCAKQCHAEITTNIDLKDKDSPMAVSMSEANDVTGQAVLARPWQRNWQADAFVSRYQLLNIRCDEWQRQSGQFSQQFRAFETTFAQVHQPNMPELTSEISSEI
jgi:hypothetical protein